MVISFIPQGLLLPLGFSGASGWHANVVASHFLLIALVLLTPTLSVIAEVPHICVMKQICGIRCPGCGITTSLLSISDGDIQRSLATNPGGPTVIVGLAMQIGIHARALVFSQTRLVMNRFSHITGLAILATLMLVWIVRI